MPGLEVVRDLLTVQSWYSGAHKSHRVIDDTNVVACIDSMSEHTGKIPRRVLFRFSLIGMEGFDS